MKTCILLGDRSDIAKALIPFLETDGWTVHGWNRDKRLPRFRWDLFLCAIGRVAPVGNWWEQDRHDFSACVTANLMLPVGLLLELWTKRNPDSSACFMAGSNPQKIMPGYLPYNISKMAIMKAVEQIDYESPDCKVFALGPGYVKTKIHKATLDANWPNERIERGDNGTPIERIWGCLKWCLAQPKEVVGGRNICASDPWDGGRNIASNDPWEANMDLTETLRRDPNKFKLRRIE